MQLNLLHHCQFDWDAKQLMKTQCGAVNTAKTLGCHGMSILLGKIVGLQ